MSKPIEAHLPTVRTEQTLRRMWEESLKLASEAGNLWATADGSRTEAEVAERTAAAHRQAEKSARGVGDAMAAEAADLTDMVNEKRRAAGLAPLMPGDQYPTDPTAPENGVTVTPTPTLTDGQLDTGEVAGK